MTVRCNLYINTYTHIEYICVCKSIDVYITYIDIYICVYAPSPLATWTTKSFFWRRHRIVSGKFLTSLGLGPGGPTFRPLSDCLDTLACPFAIPTPAACTDTKQRCTTQGDSQILFMQEIYIEMILAHVLNYLYIKCTIYILENRLRGVGSSNNKKTVRNLLGDGLDWYWYGLHYGSAAAKQSCHQGDRLHAHVERITVGAMGGHRVHCHPSNVGMTRDHWVQQGGGL